MGGVIKDKYILYPLKAALINSPHPQGTVGQQE